MDHSKVIHHIDAAIRFFLYLLIFMLPYSSAVIESSVVIASILWIIKRSILGISIKKKGGGLKEVLKAYRPAESVLDQPILMFISACFLSILLSSTILQSWQNFMTKTMEWFVVYYLVLEVFKEKKHIKIAIAVFLFTAISTVIDGLYQFYISSKDFFNGNVIPPRSRATAGFKTGNGLGGFLTIMLFVSLGVLLIKQWSKKTKLLLFMGLLLSVWVLVVTFSRGAWLGVLLGMLIFLVLYSRYVLNIKLNRISLAMVFVIIIGGFLFMVTQENSFAQRFTGTWRLSLWKDSLVLAREKLLMGYGINTYMALMQEYRLIAYPAHVENPSYAHNCFVQMLMEIGLFGLSAFVWMMYQMFSFGLNQIKTWVKQSEGNVLFSIGLLTGIMAFLVHCFFDTNLYTLQLSVYLWYMIGIFIAFNQKNILATLQ